MPHELVFQTRKQLQSDLVSLRIRLREAEQAISAICSGSIDALVSTDQEFEKIYTLRGAETPYRSFVEHMREGAVSMSLDGTMLYANRRFADMVGSPLELVVGRNLREFVESRIAVDGLLDQAEWGASRGELKLTRRGGANLIAFASIQRLVGENADLCMVVTDLTDIVAARLLVGELEDRVGERTSELLAKNLELQGFTYSVSHDMRTPLRAIVSNANMVMLDEGDNLSESGRKQLQGLSSAAMKMAQLVDDLLQFARLGGCALAVEKTDLSKLAMRVAEDIGPSHPGCEIDMIIAPDLWVTCDARFLGMALQNLFDNACKYRKVGEAAHVTVASEQCGDETVYFVKDDGIGFDMRYVKKLFMPFERLHRDSEYAGTGIGLANVKRAIERHGGRVWAESQPGSGAKFSFTLPNLA